MRTWWAGRGRRVQVPLGGVEVQRRGEAFHRLVDLLGRHKVILGVHHVGVVGVTKFRAVKIGIILFRHFERCVVAAVFHHGTHARGKFHATTRGTMRSYVITGQINGAILSLIVAAERRRRRGVRIHLRGVIVVIKIIIISGHVVPQRRRGDGVVGAGTPVFFVDERHVALAVVDFAELGATGATHVRLLVAMATTLALITRLKNKTNIFKIK